MDIEIGTPATFTIWTDRTPCTVIDVQRNGKLIVLQEDKRYRVDKNGISEAQEYLYEPNPEGRIIKVSRRTYGDGEVVYKKVGVKTNSDGCYATFGERRAYWDPGF